MTTSPTPAAPFFSAALLQTRADGTYSGIRSRQLVKAFDDRIELGQVPIYYQYLTDMRLYGDILHVVYAASDGKSVEQYFRHDTFIPSKGKKELAAMVQRADAARAKVAKPSGFHAAAAPADARPAVRAEVIRDEGGWRMVALYSSLVAFPAICPVCTKPADTVANFGDAMGIIERGAAGWIVPVCNGHEKSFKEHMRLGKFGAERARLQFAFANQSYATQFVMVNQAEDREALRRQTEAAPLWYDLKNGKRFVVYQYAVSMIVISTLRVSPYEVLGPADSRFVRGLKYSAMSLLAGWWSIPHGPIFTIVSIVRNCRGGIDLTPAVRAALTGTAISGGR
jgi:hypothetical protein